jgi:hypothetical protein
MWHNESLILKHLSLRNVTKLITYTEALIAKKCDTIFYLYWSINHWEMWLNYLYWRINHWELWQRLCRSKQQVVNLLKSLAKAFHAYSSCIDIRVINLGQSSKNLSRSRKKIQRKKKSHNLRLQLANSVTTYVLNCTINM